MVVITFVQEPTIHYTIDVKKVYFLMILHYNVSLISSCLLTCNNCNIRDVGETKQNKNAFQ